MSDLEEQPGVQVFFGREVEFNRDAQAQIVQ